MNIGFMRNSISIEKHGKVSIDRLFKNLVNIYLILLPIGTGLSGVIGSISLMNYIAVSIVLLAGVRIFSYSSINYYAIPTIAYFLFTIVSFIWSTNQHLSWYVSTNAMNFLVLIAMNLNHWDESDVVSLKRSITISQIIVILAVIKNISSLFDYRLNITIFSTIGTSDFACGLCLIIAFWMYLAAQAEKSIEKVIAYLCIAFDFAVIIMTGSRGAAAMFIAMAIVWVVMGKYSRKTKIVTILMIIIAIIGFQHYFINYLPSTITNRMTIDAIMEGHGSGRFNIWRIAFQQFEESNLFNIIFGHGFNSFIQVVQYSQFGGHIDMMAHNAFIQTMIEGGVIGLFLMIWMWISQFKMAWKNEDTIMKIALTGLFVASLSIDMQVTRIWGFILAYNCATNARKMSKNDIVRGNSRA